MPRRSDAEIAAAKRKIAWGGIVLAVIGIIGLIIASSLYLLWVALIAFGTVTLPSDAWNWWRERKRRSTG